MSLSHKSQSEKVANVLLCLLVKGILEGVKYPNNAQYTTQQDKFTKIETFLKIHKFVQKSCQMAFMNRFFRFFNDYFCIYFCLLCNPQKTLQKFWDCSRLKGRKVGLVQGVTKSQQKLICNSIYVCCLAQTFQLGETKIFTTQLSSSRWKEEATEGLILSLLFLLFPASAEKFTLAAQQPAVSISRVLLYFIRPNSLLDFVVSMKN